MPIRVLPEQLIHQIAAGEVIERPASVLKELIENSIDAGARRIEIEVEEGGVRLCRVRDDGGGIDRDELVLAFARHATSKITTHRRPGARRHARLSRRGTAEHRFGVAHASGLAQRECIAGVCDRSRQRRRHSPEPAAHPVGTTVEVRDLFFNVPARRKFLRAERTETQHIARMVERLALSRFEVAFSLTAGRRSLADYPAASSRDRTRAPRRAGGRRRVHRQRAVRRARVGGLSPDRLAVPADVRARAARSPAFLSERPHAARPARRRARSVSAIAT